MTRKKQIRPRSKTATVSRQRYERLIESDSTYLLKLVVFVLLGMFWLRFAQPVSWQGIPFNGIPIGLLIGVLLVHRFEPSQLDRKIWYAILIIVTIISNFFPAGIVI
jgi:hypothetical protein